MKGEKIVSLAEAPQLESACHQLIADNFPAGAPCSPAVSIEQEFPSLLSRPDRVWVLKNADEQVLACAAWKPYEILIPGFTTPLMAAGFGLIVTDSKARKKGYSQRLQLQIEEEARKAGACLSVLWSDLVPFYTQRGYVIVGQELEWNLDAANVKILGHRLKDEAGPHANYLVRRTNEGDLVACQQIHAAENVGPKRDLSLWKNFLHWPNSFGWVLCNQKNIIEGYALMGKARDLRAIVHELAAPKEALPQLLQACLAQTPQQLQVQLPLSIPLREELEYWLGASITRPLGFFKILNAAGFCHYLNHSQNYLPSAMELRAEAPRVQIYYRGKKLFESFDAGHLLQIFMGPWMPSEIEGLGEPLRAALKDLKPLPLYVWGLDGV